MTGMAITDFAQKMNQIIPEIMKGFARRQNNEVYKGKITLPQLLILELLSRQGASKMTDLAKYMQVTTAASTGIVERLVRQGYVQRAYDQNDRRIVRIKLNTKGTELLKKISQQRAQSVTRIFSQISEDDRAEYLRILMQVKDILDKEES
ncbi:MAG: MarR family transcriptional regulator [Candidatus Omnitrophica bacterium]|nr:MarR family transcriptional regulator [Candidatus Omnitrophota bacterium]MBU4302920.1 MarR family transcriptional regulator [Candidatus Omnitrophota bacterium]MBU4418878.1 MarR family transcriptional regulator [Candidatus Omnitrophota bacterium]MBU4468316.1 MarR family transcriptional regulator [Candidatus Omnitrophota bacterium]MCG2707208.1 MarR family transcriptional regulator [Candidatus Omnitrophota bacterium]